MSKGSMWWGNATGKVGQTVLSVLKGQQIARAYQPNVGNPRTEQQTLQRAKFATAVKFYKSATLGSFKFAFENKRPTESDYNAFMRVNKGSNLLVNRNGYTNPNYPAVYPWKLSEGSLPHVDVVSTQGDDYADFYCGAHTEDIITVQALARALCVANGLPGSTIFTLVHISNAITDVRDYTFDTPSSYILAQFQDGQSSDTRTLSQLAQELGVDEITADSSKAYMRIAMEGGVQGIAIIPTVQTANGLRVGASEVQLNDMATEFMGNCIEGGYIDEALTSWGATGKAILQGALLPASESGNFIEITPKLIVLAPEGGDEIVVSGLPSGTMEAVKVGDSMSLEINGEPVNAVVQDEDALLFVPDAPYAALEIGLVADDTISILNSTPGAVAVSFKSIEIGGILYVVRQ